MKHCCQILDDFKKYANTKEKQFIYSVIEHDEIGVNCYLADNPDEAFLSDVLLEVIIKRNALNTLHEMAELLQTAGAVITQPTLNAELVQAARSANVDMMMGLCRAGANLQYQEEGKTAVEYLPLDLQESFKARLEMEMPDVYLPGFMHDAEYILDWVYSCDLSKIKNKVYLSDLLCKVIVEGDSSSAFDFIIKLKEDRAVDVFCTLNQAGSLPLHCVVDVIDNEQAISRFNLLTALLSVAPFMQLNTKDQHGKLVADYAKKFERFEHSLRQYEASADFFDYQYYMKARKDSGKYRLEARAKACDKIFDLFLHKRFLQCQQEIERAIHVFDVFLVPSKNVKILRGILCVSLSQTPIQKLQILYDDFIKYSADVVFTIKKPSAYIVRGLFAYSDQSREGNSVSTCRVGKAQRAHQIY
jgi:hypothetical protein